MGYFLKENEKIYFGAYLFILGIILFFLGTSPSLTGAFIGAENMEWARMRIVGIIFLMISLILILSKQKSLEAIMVPTSDRKKLDYQRAIAGAKLYLQNPESKVIISGILNGERNRFLGSQTSSIYKTLRRNGVPRGHIEIEGKSKTSRENVEYTSKILMNQDIHEVTIVSDTDHSRRLGRLFVRAAEKGKAPRDLRIRTPRVNVEKAYGLLKAELAYAKDSILTNSEEKKLKTVARGLIKKFRGSRNL